MDRIALIFASSPTFQLNPLLTSVLNRAISSVVATISCYKNKEPYMNELRPCTRINAMNVVDVLTNMPYGEKRQRRNCQRVPRQFWTTF